MTRGQKLRKRIFDLSICVLGLIFLGWLILILSLLSLIDTRSSGIILQKRVGYNGKVFNIFKIRTIKPNSYKGDKRISAFGKFLRKNKLDEFPQLFNVLIGNMSMVGPRPDIPGFADQLKGEYRIILSVKPGITGPASIFFRNEEELLNKQQFPDKYNRDVIWPQKIELNKKYVQEFSFKGDFIYILKTILIILRL